MADSGASLVEAVIVAALLCAALSGLAPLLAWSRRVIREAGAETMAVALASQKLEQLRALTFHVIDDGGVVSDERTEVAAAEPAEGGSGLRASPPGTLDADTAGYVDYLDLRGVWRGSGTVPPAGSSFVRRWAIAPYVSDPLHAVVLHVVVIPLSDANGRRPFGEVRLTTIRARGAP